MSNFTLQAILVTCLGVLGTQSATASTTKLQDSALDEVAAFEEQRSMIERELADGETYSEITPEDRTTVRSALNRIGASLESSGSVDGMSDKVKTQLFNDQELVNNILTDAGEDSRLVCERRIKTGSNRKVSVCLTVAERRRRHEESQQTLQDVYRRRLCDANGGVLGC